MSGSRSNAAASWIGASWTAAWTAAAGAAGRTIAGTAGLRTAPARKPVSKAARPGTIGQDAGGAASGKAKGTGSIRGAASLLRTCEAAPALPAGAARRWRAITEPAANRKARSAAKPMIGSFLGKEGVSGVTARETMRASAGVALSASRAAASR
ncbi:hypothetical protein AEGHOMDF_4083 [Methylobacterium soli]|nr:hypothetical protein AEGHOMDF_4083 [Methylobacterium soli]